MNSEENDSSRRRASSYFAQTWQGPGMDFSLCLSSVGSKPTLPGCLTSRLVPRFGSHGANTGGAGGLMHGKTGRRQEARSKPTCCRTPSILGKEHNELQV